MLNIIICFVHCLNVSHEAEQLNMFFILNCEQLTLLQMLGNKNKRVHIFVHHANSSVLHNLFDF